MKLEMQKTPLYIVGAAIVLAFLPWLGLPAFYDSLLYLVLHWVVLALSWNILSGYSGYFSFGHNAFFGTGIYASATLMDKFGWSFLATLPVAAGVACIVGLIIGVIVFRVRGIRGEVFALLTLAVTFVISTIIVNTPIDGGNGVMLSADVPAIGPRASATFYLLALAAATLAMLVAWRVATSRLGAGLFAIHDDEDAAEVMGVPTYRYKLYALAITSSLAGLAGGIHALFLSYVTPDAVFTISVPLTVILMSVLGGTRHWAGPVVGAVAITLLMYSFTAADHAVAGKAMIGVVLIAAILFMPDGILGFILKKRKKAAASGAAAGAPAAHQAVVEKSADQADAQEQLGSTVVEFPTRASNEDKLAKAPILLEVRGLRKSFRGLHALDGVDLTVREGEILGLLGPNGSGKSTFINVISGHFPATAGQVIFEGRDITELPAHDIAHSGIARTYQIPRPFAHMTALQNVALVAMFGNSALTQAEAEREAMQWLEFTGLQDRAHVLPDDLNLHQRKFLELARALAGRPRLVLLDEVLSGLTPSEIHEAVALIRKIRDRGATIVFVEHVMSAVMALTDRIAVFNQGKLLAVGLGEEVMSNSAVVSAYLGKELDKEKKTEQGHA